MTRCKATKKNGNPCPTIARPSGYCFFHDPDPALAKKRDAARLKGGEARVAQAGGRANVRKALQRKTFDPAELGEVKLETKEQIVQLLAKTAEGLLTGKLTPDVSSAVASLANVARQALKEGDTDARVKKLEEQTRVLKDVSPELLVEIVRTARAARSGVAAEH